MCGLGCDVPLAVWSPFFAAACAHLSNTASKWRGVALELLKELKMFLDENGADKGGEDFDLAAYRSFDGRPSPIDGGLWEQPLRRWALRRFGG